MRAIFLIALGALLLFQESGQALGLSDHKRVTLQAISEFNQCFNHSIDGISTGVLWMSNLDEDLNIIRKDLIYSHYYNPEKPLKMFRYDSRVRVGVLAKEIEIDDGIYGRGNDFSLNDVAHLIHHLQDMASPPHVIPVSHGLFDGFEQNLEVSGEISSSLSCEELRHVTENYLELHQNTALATLNTVRKQSFGLEIQNKPVVLPILSFWSLAEDTESSGFGQYGVLGNVFGQTQFQLADKSYTVSANFYQEFKRQQLKLAVRSSLKALVDFYLEPAKK